MGNVFALQAQENKIMTWRSTLQSDETAKKGENITDMQNMANGKLLTTLPLASHFDMSDCIKIEK